MILKALVRILNEEMEVRQSHQLQKFYFSNPQIQRGFKS